MWKDLFIHLCIVLTFLFVGGLFFQKDPFISSSRTKWFVGLIAGALGSLLMKFSIHFDNHTIMDMRHIPMIFSAVYGSAFSAVLASILIAASRILFFELSKAAIIAAVGTIIVGALLGFMQTFEMAKVKKWGLMLIASTAIYSIVLYLLIGNRPYFYEVLAVYWGLSLLSGAIVYYLAAYVFQANQLNYEYRQQATVDFLTGLKNKRAFQRTVNDLLWKANEKNNHMALLYIDIDYFKKVNDTYGHPAGDAVLKELAKVLTNTTRLQDLLFRNGGEEFAIIAAGANYLEAVQIAERIRKVVEAHEFVLPNGTAIYCTISIGIGTNTAFNETVSQLIAKADAALYKAKTEGRNKVC